MSHLIVCLFYQNVKVLRSKLVVFHFTALVQKHHVISIFETWIGNNILNSEFSEGYFIFRCVRNRFASCKCAGGRVLIARKQSTPRRTHFSSSGSLYDCVALRVFPSNSLQFIVLCIYISCACPSHLYEELFDRLSELLTIKFPFPLSSSAEI